MIRSFSQAPAFQKLIKESRYIATAKTPSYYWKRRQSGAIEVYFRGQVFDTVASTTEAALKVKEHAIQMNLFEYMPLPEHYYRFDKFDKIWLLYVNSRYSKRSKDKGELENYLQIMTWLHESGHGKGWSNK
jgi:uncharacterized pyridoxamine 5'-phosphate oxidase family protein